MHIESLLSVIAVLLFIICGQLSCAVIQESIQYPKEIRSAANLDIDPCENMYEYGCGTWLAETAIPSHMTKYSSFLALNEKLEVQLRDMLEKDIEITDSHHGQIIKLYYKACVDIASRNAAGAKYLIQDLDAIGSWPMANKNTIVRETKDISEFEINMTKVFSSKELVNFKVRTDFKDSSRQMIRIAETYTTLNRKKYLNKDEYRNDQTNLKAWITKTAQMIARDSNREVPPDLDIQVEQLFQFEKDLAKITGTKQERRRTKLRYNPYRLADVEKLMDGVITNMLRIRDIMKARFQSSPVDVILTDDLEINVENVTFVRSYMKLLQNTSKRTIVNFIIWKKIKGIIGDLGESYQKVDEDYKRETTGQMEREDRWQYCVKIVNSELPEAVSALYVKEYIDPSIKSSVTDLVDRLKIEFAKIIKNSKWMDSTTQANAIKKLRWLITGIAYPDYMTNNTILDEVHSKLLLNNTQSFYEMARTVAHWYDTTEGENLFKPVTRNNWSGMQPTKVNAGYYVETNTMVYPAAILQPPFYFPGGPDSLNYGAIGSVIGHELSHGFDNRGRNFDFKGKLNNWWSNASGHAFDRRADCFVKQYSSYMIPELNKMLDGGLTLADNIGDNGGVRAAYDALKSKHGDGFAGSHDEMAFFRGWTRIWCTKKTIEKLEIDRLSDVHAAPIYRVNGVFGNMPEFQSAYNCSPTAMMIRPGEEKCRIW